MVQQKLPNQLKPKRTHPSVGEDGITLLHQDGFDHGSVRDTQHWLPSIVQAGRAAVAVNLGWLGLGLTLTLTTDSVKPPRGPVCKIWRSVGRNTDIQWRHVRLQRSIHLNQGSRRCRQYFCTENTEECHRVEGVGINETNKTEEIREVHIKSHKLEYAPLLTTVHPNVVHWTFRRRVPSCHVGQRQHLPPHLPIFIEAFYVNVVNSLNKDTQQQH